MEEKSLKELISRLYDMNQSAGECIYLLQNALIYNSLKSLDECEAKIKEINASEKILTAEFVEKAKANPEVRVYVGVPGHVERIGHFIGNIVRCSRVKIREGISFSDRASSEITFLLERLQEVLKKVSDIILARNAIVREYVKESVAEMGWSADGFAATHEERLIDGSCTPEASPLFLDILDAIKVIGWHAKEIAERLTKLSKPSGSRRI
jgi:Na+/phosphate symporter